MSIEDSGAEQIVRSFADTWNRHDIEAFADLFADDAEFVNVVGLWWKGKPQIKAAHEYTHQTLFRQSHLAISDLTVRFPAPRISIARCRWELTGHVDPDGHGLPARNGILVNVLQFDGTAWRIIDSQNTDVIEGVLSRPQ